MAKGDNSLTVKLTMTSSNLFPWNLNMARETTLTVPGTSNGNASKMGQGTITSSRININNRPKNRHILVSCTEIIISCRTSRNSF